MSANTNIDLAVLHQAIVADFKAQFPNLVTVEFYREDRDTLPLPAALLELTELDAIPEDDPGTGQLAVMAKFEVELVIGFRTPEAKQSIRILAAAIAAWLRMRRWTNPADPTRKLPTGEAQVIGAFQDDFSVIGRSQNRPLEQFEVWRVEWQQRVHLGKTVWTEGGTLPSSVFVGQAPDIGTGNEGNYDQVVPE